MLLSATLPSLRGSKANRSTAEMKEGWAWMSNDRHITIQGKGHSSMLSSVHQCGWELWVLWVTACACMQQQQHIVEQREAQMATRVTLTGPGRRAVRLYATVREC